MLARHEWANSASGAVPLVLIGGITKADFKTAAALQRLGDCCLGGRDQIGGTFDPQPGIARKRIA
jgi:hypothetical protein